MKNTNRLLSRRTAMTALSLSAVILLGTACSSGTVSVTDSASQTNGNLPGDVFNGIPTLKELANDGKGEYIQTTISDDDPAMKFNPALAAPESTNAYTNEEVAEAQKVIMRFIAEEGIDSIINNNVSDMENIEAWWEKNKHKIDPSKHNSFRSKLTSKDMSYALVMRANRVSDLVYGKDKVRVVERTITPTEYTVRTTDGINYIQFEAKADFTMLRKTKDEVVPEKTTADFAYVVTKNNSGEWLLTGYKNTFHINKS